MHRINFNPFKKKDDDQPQSNRLRRTQSAPTKTENKKNLRARFKKLQSALGLSRTHHSKENPNDSSQDSRSSDEELSAKKENPLSGNAGKEKEEDAGEQPALKRFSLLIKNATSKVMPPEKTLPLLELPAMSSEEKISDTVADSLENSDSFDFDPRDQFFATPNQEREAQALREEYQRLKNINSTRAKFFNIPEPTTLEDEEEALVATPTPGSTTPTQPNLTKSLLTTDSPKTKPEIPKLKLNNINPSNPKSHRLSK